MSKTIELIALQKVPLEELEVVNGIDKRVIIDDNDDDNIERWGEHALY